MKPNRDGIVFVGGMEASNPPPPPVAQASPPPPPPARTSDHDVPYAPVPAVAYKLAAVLPVSSVLMQDAPYDGVDGLWRAYWRRREFNQLRHPNPFPRFRPLRWLP